jgi:hypothetical protein
MSNLATIDQSDKAPLEVMVDLDPAVWTGTDTWDEDPARYLASHFGRGYPEEVDLLKFTCDGQDLGDIILKNPDHARSMKPPIFSVVGKLKEIISDYFPSDPETAYVWQRNRISSIIVYGALSRSSMLEMDKVRQWKSAPYFGVGVALSAIFFGPYMIPIGLALSVGSKVKKDLIKNEVFKHQMISNLILRGGIKLSEE